MLRSLHLDLNSFFASVEQQAQPRLRGRPMAVIAVETDSTSCLAASREAKLKGVKTGTNVAEARRLCPGITFVLANTRRYLEAHHAVLRAIDTVWPIHKVWSIDEVECRLSGVQREPGEAEKLARRMKRAIREQAGECLTCSIGIAPNQLLAKLGTDMQKPDGLVMFRPCDLPEKLLPVALGDVVGIGPRMEERLHARGITTMGQLLAKTEREMVEVWGGVMGARLYRALRGELYTEPRRVQQHIGHQHVMEPALRTGEGARRVLVKLIHKAAARARADGQQAGLLVIGVVPEGEGTRVNGGWMRWGNEWSQEKLLEPATSDTLALLEAFGTMWPEGWAGPPGRPKMVMATLLRLERAECATMPLFVPVKPRDKVGETIDRINGRFGVNTIYAASMTGAVDAAPPRIAFSSVPSLKVLEEA